MGWELNWEELGTGGTLLDRHFVNSYWIPNDHVKKECRKVVMGSRNRTHASKQLPNITTPAPILVRLRAVWNRPELTSSQPSESSETVGNLCGFRLAVPDGSEFGVLYLPSRTIANFGGIIRKRCRIYVEMSHHYRRV